MTIFFANLYFHKHHQVPLRGIILDIAELVLQW